ncbi:hypothetical protein EUX98_g309 [Antrodiella citrinella]|uniref:NYN domain-containing protein n=1 Tax=Antrodiella citrinella TaxID=2447956 RepID=A0A4S4ND27_9APHY|nr:hypothetical protein EUX98_g309 [Antrodiella citrinella]
MDRDTGRHLRECGALPNYKKSIDDFMSRLEFGPVAIFWELNYCVVPPSIPISLVVRELSHLGIQFGRVIRFDSYCPHTDDGLRMRPRLLDCGMSVIDAPPNRGKEIIDVMFISEVMTYAMDTPAPALIFIISGDADIAYLVSTLTRRNYKVVVLGLKERNAGAKDAASYYHDWNDFLAGIPIPDDYVESVDEASESGSATSSEDTEVEEASGAKSPPFSPTADILLHALNRDVSGPSESDVTERLANVVLDPSAQNVALDPSVAPSNADTPTIPAAVDAPAVVDTPAAPAVGLPTVPVTSAEPATSNAAGQLAAPSIRITCLKEVEDGYRPLVRVLERERLRGASRVPFSQLGKKLVAEVKMVYKAVGKSKLSDYLTLAMSEERHIVLIYSDNRNQWVALHPAYHGYEEAGVAPAGPSAETPGSSQTVTTAPKIASLKEVEVGFRPLVRVLERERLIGHSRVQTSLLGKLVLREVRNAYKAVGKSKLSEYLQLAMTEERHIVILGSEGAKQWAALHHAYHGYEEEQEKVEKVEKVEEAQTAA